MVKILWVTMALSALAASLPACAADESANAPAHSPEVGIAPPTRIPDVLESLPEPAGTAVPSAAVPQAVRRAVVADAAKRFKVAESAVVLTRAEQVTWSDGSLGCPEPGRYYTQNLVPGYRIAAKTSAGELIYHTDSRGNVVSCGRRRLAAARGAKAARTRRTRDRSACRETRPLKRKHRVDPRLRETSGCAHHAKPRSAPCNSSFEEFHSNVADEVRRTRRSPGYGHPAHLEVAAGTGPCRCCLRPFVPGKDQRLLFTYRPPGEGDESHRTGTGVHPRRTLRCVDGRRFSRRVARAAAGLRSACRAQPRQRALGARRSDGGGTDAGLVRSRPRAMAARAPCRSRLFHRPRAKERPRGFPRGPVVCRHADGVSCCRSPQRGSRVASVAFVAPPRLAGTEVAVIDQQHTRVRIGPREHAPLLHSEVALLLVASAGHPERPR